MTRRGHVERQRLMPEAAANPAGSRPRSVGTQPVRARLYDGHLTAECSIRDNGAPACPACLRLRLDHWRCQ